MIGDVIFEKHALGRKQRKVVDVDNLDPRPFKYRGTEKEHVSTLLDKIRKGLCILLMVDSKVSLVDS